jgi:predicted DsbA family dithiol-disulfide isomerase/uncharacterized membrane protein
VPTWAWLTLYRLSALIAVLFSTLLLIHYVSPVNSGFCAAEGGCEMVRARADRFFGDATTGIPLLGVLAYSGLFIASLFASPRLRKNLQWPSALGAIVALGFIVVQAVVIQAFCWMCMVVDGAAVLVGFAGIQISRASPALAEPLKAWAWSTLLASTIGLSALWHWVRPPTPVPAEILALYQPGKINVVEFADFQCPHCNRFHPLLKKAMRERGDQVHFVRKHMPLLQHRFAEHAAKGAVCAEAQGKGEDMADFYFRHHLKQDIAFAGAADLNLDLSAFRACMEDPATVARLDADRALLERVGFQGLPTTFIGNRQLVGAQPSAVIREALDQAAEGEPPIGVSGPLYLAFAALSAAVVVALGRKKPVAMS